MSLAKDLRATKISGIEQGLSRASESSPVTEFGKSLATVTVVCKFSICFASYKGLKCLIAADFNVCCPLKMLPAVSSISQMCFLLLQELAKFVKKFGVKITIFNPVISANLSPNGFFFKELIPF